MASLLAPPDQSPLRLVDQGFTLSGEVKLVFFLEHVGFLRGDVLLARWRTLYRRRTQHSLAKSRFAVGDADV